MKTRKPKAPPVPPTREERIEEVYQTLVSRRYVSNQVTAAGWELKPGDHVEIGNLNNVHVVETRQDGRAIIVEFDTHATRDNPNPTTRELGAWWWFSCVPVVEGMDHSAKFYKDKHRNTYNTSSLSSLIDTGLAGEYRDNPDYQRGYVWQLADKVALVDSIMNAREIGKFILVRYPWPDNHDEVLDGKQRLNALVEFCSDGFPYHGVYWSELSRTDRRRFEDSYVQVAQLDGERLKRVDLLEIFLNVNAGGVPQSEEHLNFVRGLLAKELEKVK